METSLPPKKSVTEKKQKQRVIFYVDGFNFYYGLRSNNWKKYYWLDMVAFCSSFLNDGHELIEVKYFSAVPLNKGNASRQQAFFDANKLNKKFKLHLGKFLAKSSIHAACGKPIDTFEEKETDVKIATHIIGDVVQKRCDLTVLISGDSDLKPPLEFIRNFTPRHNIMIYFPPLRKSVDLQKLSNASIKLSSHEQKFKANQLPPSINMASGYVLNKPPSWV